MFLIELRVFLEEQQKTLDFIILVQIHQNQVMYSHLLVTYQQTNLVERLKHLFMVRLNWLSYTRDLVRLFVLVLMDLHIVVVGVLKVDSLGYHQSSEEMQVSM